MKVKDASALTNHHKYVVNDLASNFEDDTSQVQKIDEYET